MTDIIGNVGKGRGLCNPRKKYRKFAALMNVSRELFEHAEIWSPIFEANCRDIATSMIDESPYTADSYRSLPDESSIHATMDGSVVVRRIWNLNSDPQRRGHLI